MIAGKEYDDDDNDDGCDGDHNGCDYDDDDSDDYLCLNGLEKPEV